MAVKGTGDDGQGDRPRFPRREASARTTRTALVRAAGELFVQQGYAATTVVQIADRAGVGRATVFASVPGGKPELLQLARDVALAGDDEPVPVPERSWFRAAMALSDPREVLCRQAGNYRAINLRAAGLELELASAARTDGRLAELYARACAQRRAGAGLVVRRLIDLAAVSPDRGDEASDTLYALAGPQVFTLLVHDRRWSPARYERWLCAQLVATVLS